MKNVSRNKLLLCFRPVVDMEELVFDAKGGLDRSKSHTGIRKKKSMGHFESSGSVSDGSSFSTSSEILDNRCSTSEEKSFIPDHSSKKKTFSSAIKAALLETILSKHLRDRKGLHRDSSKRGFLSTKSRKSLDISDGNNSVNKLNPFVLSSSSARSSSISESKTLEKSSSTKKNDQNPDQETKPQPKKINNYGLYLFLVSLTVTVCWGKLCAILFTSIWLYLLSCQNALNEIYRPETAVKSPEKKEGKEHNKKRVIMEGPLDRKSGPESQRDKKIRSRFTEEDH